MKNLSRGAWIAIAAAIAVPTTFAVAQAYKHGGGMSAGTRQRLQDGKIAGAKAALKLTAEQEKLWQPVEDQIRTVFKDREDRRAERMKMREERRKDRAEKKDEKPSRPDMAERLEKMSQRMSERAERMKAFSEAFKPFYASLSDEQKTVLRPLVRGMMPGMGRGHKGPRWAMGGGWGGHGRHGQHHWGHHGGPKGGHGHGMESKAPAADAPAADTDADGDDK